MRAALTRTLLACLCLLASACGVLQDAPPASGADTLCLIDKPIGWAEGDTEETISRVTEHDRRLYCLCPEVYPEKHELMECPK